ncbi:unnamed protein product [Cochlearia groenlandica]
MGNSKISTIITSPLILRKQRASYKEGEFAVAISSEEIQRDSIEISLKCRNTRYLKGQDICLVAGVNCDGLVRPKKVTKSHIWKVRRFASSDAPREDVKSQWFAVRKENNDQEFCE